MKNEAQLIERLNHSEISEAAKKIIIQEFKNADEELYRIEGFNSGTKYTTVERNTETFAITTCGNIITKSTGSVRYFNKFVTATKVA